MIFPEYSIIFLYKEASTAITYLALINSYSALIYIFLEDALIYFVIT